MTTKVHKVFVSFHHDNDEKARENFEKILTDNGIAVVRSVQEGEYDRYENTDAVREKIRDEHLRECTVTIVLVGVDTWKRKHIDWEISASIRDTKYNPRAGLLGILLPTHPSYKQSGYNPYIVPPRLHDNIKCGFANMYEWTDNPVVIQNIIDESFDRRNKILPDNSFPSFVNNRSGDRWQY